MPREQKPEGNQAVPRCGRGVQVTVTSTTEHDMESRLPMNESLPALPWTEEKGDIYPPELTEEEQQIRTLEHQMMQDLDI